MTKEFEMTKIGAEKGIDLRLDIQDSLLPNLVLQGEFFQYIMLCN
jgi:hypothetical protein